MIGQKTARYVGTPGSVLRGGSWNDNGNDLRVANRNRNDPTNTNNNIGFRCARSLARDFQARMSHVHGRAARAEVVSAGVSCPVSRYWQG
jgi:hypothetical protein